MNPHRPSPLEVFSSRSPKNAASDLVWRDEGVCPTKDDDMGFHHERNGQRVRGEEGWETHDVAL